MEIRLEDISREIVRSKTFPELVLALEVRGIDVSEKELVGFLFRKVVDPENEFRTGNGTGTCTSIRDDEDLVDLWPPVRNMLLESGESLRGTVSPGRVVSLISSCVLFLRKCFPTRNRVVSDRISFAISLSEGLFPGLFRTIRFGELRRGILDEVFSRLGIVEDVVYFSNFASNRGELRMFTISLLQESRCVDIVRKLLFEFGADPFVSGNVPVWELFGEKDIQGLKTLLESCVFA